MKTAMQQYFDYLRNRYGDKGVPSNYEYWLDIEKKQIIDAFDEGQEYEYQYHINSTPKFDSETYYNEIYN